MIVFGEEPGWFGAFTRHQATAAISNGATVVKAREERTGRATANSS